MNKTEMVARGQRDDDEYYIEKYIKEGGTENCFVNFQRMPLDILIIIEKELASLKYSVFFFCKQMDHIHQLRTNNLLRAFGTQGSNSWKSI